MASSTRTVWLRYSSARHCGYARRRRRRSGGDVGVRQHDERIRSAEFEHLSFEMTGRGGGHELPDFGRRRQRERLDAVVGDEVGDLFCAHEQGGEQPGWAHLVDDVGDVECALRNVWCVFEHDPIAGRNCRWGEPEHFPQWEVPGRDHQHQPQRLVGHVGPLAEVDTGWSASIAGPCSAWDSQHHALLSTSAAIPGADCPSPGDVRGAPCWRAACPQ